MQTLDIWDMDYKEEMNMYKAGDKFIIEIEESCGADGFSQSGVWGVKGFSLSGIREETLNLLEKYVPSNTDYEKGLSDAWECLKKIRNSNEEELREIFNLPFAARIKDVLNNCTPQEAIDKLKAWEEKHEIKVGDVIISSEGNKAVIQFITPNGEWECFNKYTYFTLNKEKQKLWKRTGKHIDLTEIFKGLEAEDAD